jgi:hypothetical protein
MTSPPTARHDHRRDRGPAELTAEEDFGFDTQGFLVLRGVLSGREVADINAQLDEGAAAEKAALGGLAAHAVAAQYAEQLCGLAFRVDRAPALLQAPAAAAESGAVRLAGGNEPYDYSRAYVNQNTSRFCQALRVVRRVNEGITILHGQSLPSIITSRSNGFAIQIRAGCGGTRARLPCPQVWALEPSAAGGGGVRLLPCSHNLNVPLPEAVARGEDGYLDAIGLCTQPALRAGDLLLHAGSLAHGLAPPPSGVALPRLVACEYGAMMARRPGDQALDRPDELPWMAELSDAGRAALGLVDAPILAGGALGGRFVSMPDAPLFALAGESRIEFTAGGT